MRRGWRKAAAVALLLSVPRCSCDPPCPSSAPHATYELASQPCGGYRCELACDKGWIDCDGDNSNGCETPTTGPHAHEVVNSYSADYGCGGSPSNQVGTIGQCTINCEPGWFDCNNNPADGCETQSVLGCYGGDAEAGLFEPTAPHVIATLSADPRGLVACAGQEFYFDGAVLYSIDSVTLKKTLVTSSPGVPAGGLACDGTYLYWATLSDSDASAPNGELFAMYIPASFADVIASGLDPGRGIDFRPSSGVYFIARTGLSDAGSMLGLVGSDGGVSPWMPIEETQAYKPFTLTTTDDWSLAGGSIYRRPLDGGVAAWIGDAGASALLTAPTGEPFAVVRATSDAGADAGDAGAQSPSDYLAHLVDDGGAASLTAVDASTVRPIVATTSWGPTVVASDDTIYLVDLYAGGTTVIATTSDHVADVALDSSWAVWTTRGQGSTPAQVWRARVQ